MQHSECEELLRSLIVRLETEIRQAKEQQARAEAARDFSDVLYADGKIIALLTAIGLILDCLSTVYRQMKP